MAKRARPITSQAKQPGAVEQQRLQKIAESKRALKQERLLVTLARQLRRSFTNTAAARQELLEQLAQECGYNLIRSDAAAAVNE